MFLERYHKGKRITVDLQGLYYGQSVFLIGGSPELWEHMCFPYFKENGIITMAMNNAGCSMIRPTMQVTADKPPCFSRRRLLDPGIMHFARGPFWKQEVEEGKQWHQVPNTFFYPLNEAAEAPTDFSKGLVWKRAVFPTAIALCLYLGFGRIYLCGCSFHRNKGDYDTGIELTTEQGIWNDRVYGNTVNHMKEWVGSLRRVGVTEVISCTSDSRLNEFYDFMTLDQALDDEMRKMPENWDFDKLVHSSKLSTVIEVKTLPNLETSP